MLLRDLIGERMTASLAVVDELFEKLDGAMAKNTIRAYRSDFEHFTKWCLCNNTHPLEHDVPAMLKYLLFVSTESKVATLNRRIASLSSLFRFLGIQDHTKHTDVFLLLKKIKRQKGSAQLQAEPLTRDMIKKLSPFVGDGLTGMRNLVLLHLGHQTMRRRSELCKFTFSDLCVLPGGRYAIKLRFSKTDQEGKGKLLPIDTQTFDLLMRWQQEMKRNNVCDACSDSDFILRGILGATHITASLSPNSVNRILQDIQARAGIITSVPFSGHSFRVGGALDLLMDGMSMEKIMLRGGWQSESTVMRYLRAWDLLT